MKNASSENLFSIGEVAKYQHISKQTLIFYDKIGLFRPAWVDPPSGYRYYSASQLDYLDTILIMKKIGFSLQEIRGIFELKESDQSGNLRREALLSEYRKKLSEDRAKMQTLQAHIDELEWHVHQLEKAEDGFTECPGALCASCEYRSRCVFFRSEGEEPISDHQ